jgi:hypothetical protein
MANDEFRAPHALAGAFRTRETSNDATLEDVA